MKDDLIVQRAAKYRVGMTNQGGMGGVGSARVEQSFEASGGAFEKQERMDAVSGGTDLKITREHERLGCRLGIADDRPQSPSQLDRYWRGGFSGCYALCTMDLFALTRRLVDIESITPNEGAVGDFLLDELRRRGFEARKMPVEGTRENVVATSKGHPGPVVVFSTHMDTVPPFIPSSDDATRIYGRGSCDAKGIIAAQVSAAEKLREEGIHVGLVVSGRRGTRFAGRQVRQQRLRSGRAFW